MTAWEAIRDARAEAAASVFRELGVRVDLVHGGATAAGLAAYAEGGDWRHDAALAPHGTAAERVLHLPRQTNFSGAVRPGDLVIYPSGGSERFVVTAVECDAHEAVYRVRARRYSGVTLTT